MKNLTVTFPERVGVTNFIAAATGPLGKLVALQKIYEAVRFTEPEMAEIKVKDLGNGMSSFEPPSADFGTVTVKIEDSDAAILLQDIEAHQNYHLSDLNWVNSVKSQLQKV